MVEICSFRQSWAHIVFARNQALGTCGLNFVFGLRVKVKLTNGEHAAPVLKEQMRSWWQAGNRSDRRGITRHYSTLVRSPFIAAADIYKLVLAQSAISTQAALG